MTVQLETNTNGRVPMESAWKWHVRRLLMINIGFLVMSAGFVLVVRAGLGTSPWDVFHMALTLHTPLTYGTAQQVSGIFLLILACWLERSFPTLGCLLNIALVGLYCDLIYDFIPAPDVWWLQWPQFFFGLLVTGCGMGLYIACKLGAGPRDWLMLTLHQRTGIAIRWVRTMIEVTVVLIGMLLSGPFGIGTILFSLLIGHPTEWGIKWAERAVGPFVERRERPA
jgi:uncharacterized membrane protein YczE